MIEHEENLIFDLLSQLMALAFHDKIFVAMIKDIANIYTVPIPPHRKGIQLKVRREKLDIPVFREPRNTSQGYRTSDSEPLKSTTWSRNIKRIGVQAGQEQNLTQKVLRRGGINAINSMGFSSIHCLYANLLNCEQIKHPLLYVTRLLIMSPMLSNTI